MKNYDPNVRWGTHYVAINLQLWDYKRRFVYPVGGNCFGFSVIEAAIDQLYEDLPGDPMEPGQRDRPYVMLYKVNGDDVDSLECADDEGYGDTWLKDMIVSTEILAMDAGEGDRPAPLGAERISLSIEYAT